MRRILFLNVLFCIFHTFSMSQITEENSKIALDQAHEKFVKALMRMNFGQKEECLNVLVEKNYEAWKSFGNAVRSQVQEYEKQKVQKTELEERNLQKMKIALKRYNIIRTISFLAIIEREKRRQDLSIESFKYQKEQKDSCKTKQPITSQTKPFMSGIVLGTGLTLSIIGLYRIVKKQLHSFC